LPTFRLDPAKVDAALQARDLTRQQIMRAVNVRMPRSKTVVEGVADTALRRQRVTLIPDALWKNLINAGNIPTIQAC